MPPRASTRIARSAAAAATTGAASSVVPSSSRRSKRVIASESAAEEDELDLDMGMDEEDDDNIPADGDDYVEEDAQGEDEDELMDGQGSDEDAEGEEEEDGDDGGEEDPDAAPSAPVSPPNPPATATKPDSSSPPTKPSSGGPLKLKFKVTVPPPTVSTSQRGKGKRKAAAAALDRFEEDQEDEEEDELMDDDSKVQKKKGIIVNQGGQHGKVKRKKVVIASGGRRNVNVRGSDSESFGSEDFEREYNNAEEESLDPLRMTARQRAKHKIEGEVEELLELPSERSNKAAKNEITEAERLRRKEENARKRKLQADQKQEEEKTDTINRLLRAQSGRTKAKIPSSLLPSRPGSGAASTSGDSGAVGDGPPPPPPTLLRFVSSVKGGEFRLTVSFPENKLDAVKMGPVHSLDDQDNGSTRRNVAGTCDVPGCGQRRIYRCVTAFDKGGCSLPHLKLVQGSLSGAANSKSEGIASS